MGFFVALQFLTIIPFPLKRDIAPQELGRSLPYFPAVGLALGLLLAGLDRVLWSLFPSPLSNALLLALFIFLTGAIHLDGFIDTCDGLAYGRSLEQRLRIMRESQVGAYGVVGAFLLLLVKYTSMLLLPLAQRLPSLILMPILSRWAMVYAVVLFPYGRETPGMGRIFKEEARGMGLALATLIALAVSLLLLGLRGIVVLALLWLLVEAGARFLLTRLAGLTGDNYGAINEVAEVAVLLLVPLASGGYA